MRILRFCVAGFGSVEVASNAKKRTHVGLSLFAQRGFYHHKACDFFSEAKHKEAKRSVDQEGTLAAGRLCGRLVEHDRSRREDVSIVVLMEHRLDFIDNGKKKPG